MINSHGIPSFIPMGNLANLREELAQIHDNSLSDAEMLISMIRAVNRMGLLVGEMADNWNTVENWIKSNGVDQSVTALLTMWEADGTLAKILDKTALKKIQSNLDSVLQQMQALNLEVHSKISNTTANVEASNANNWAKMFELINKSIGNGVIEDVYNTLDYLKAKYPTGTKGLFYIVDTQHIYYWNTDIKAWTDGGSIVTNSEIFNKLIGKNSAYVEQPYRVTQAEITELNNPANKARWTFSLHYPKGYVKGAWLYIVSDEDQEYSISLISATTSRILYSVSGKGHGKIVVPVNTFLRDEWLVSIKCNSFGFSTSENTGNKYSNQVIGSTEVGTEFKIVWEDSEKSWNPAFEALYNSADENIFSLYSKFETTPYAKTTSEHNFNNIKYAGEYWITRNNGDNSPVIVNAPENATWGNYYLHVSQFNDANFKGGLRFTCQTVISYGSEAGNGMWFRYVLYNPDDSVNIDNSLMKWIKCSNTENYIEKNKMFVAGDSITAGHPYENQKGIHWWENVERRSGYEITVGAQNGSGLLYKKGDISAITITDSTDFSQFDVAVLAFGTNDYGNNMELGKVGDIYPSQETIYGAINYIIKKVYASNPSITLIFITPINRCDKGTVESNYGYGTQNAKGYTLLDVVNAIKEQTTKYGVNYVDNTNSPFNAFSITSLLGDKLHPTVDGYKILGGHYSAGISNIITPFVTY